MHNPFEHFDDIQDVEQQGDAESVSSLVKGVEHLLLVITVTRHASLSNKLTFILCSHQTGVVEHKSHYQDQRHSHNHLCNFLSIILLLVSTWTKQKGER